MPFRAFIQDSSNETLHTANVANVFILTLFVDISQRHSFPVSDFEFSYLQVRCTPNFVANGVRSRSLFYML